MSIINHIVNIKLAPRFTRQDFHQIKCIMFYIYIKTATTTTMTATTTTATTTTTTTTTTEKTTLDRDR